MDNNSTEPDFPILEIASFVDAHTAVLIGPHAEDVEEGDELYVLGIGFSVIPKVDVPLMAPKAKLEATFVPGPYVLAKAPVEKIETETSAAVIRRLLEGVQLTERRQKLTTAEQFFLGDPGKEPIKIGDIVVRASDLKNYIQYRASKK